MEEAENFNSWKQFTFQPAQIIEYNAVWEKILMLKELRISLNMSQAALADIIFFGQLNESHTRKKQKQEKYQLMEEAENIKSWKQTTLQPVQRTEYNAASMGNSL